MIVAAAGIAAALFFAQAAAPAAAPLAGGPAPDRFTACVAAIEANAEQAYESAMAWANETRDIQAHRCAAMALIEQGRVDQGARRLEGLAASAMDPSVAAALWSQTGNAWLLAGEPSRARSAFTRLVTSIGEDRDALPDAYIDRALAYAGERDWRKSEEDLSRALDIRPNDALALRMRARARMHQSAFDLALADAQAAVAAAPGDVDARLVLGHVMESRRTGTPVEEQ
ncbi:MAG: tetratricopeptide repeat protein [Hyphomonadaceae bacterium]|nr:tetratricopeptide repeat protein [Hyphomonadaceae bacterium]